MCIGCVDGLSGVCYGLKLMKILAEWKSSWIWRCHQVSGRTFWRTVGVKHSVLWNAGNYSPTDTVSHLRRLESSATLLWAPHISQKVFDACQQATNSCKALRYEMPMLGRTALGGHCRLRRLIVVSQNASYIQRQHNLLVKWYAACGYKLTYVE